MRKIKTQATPNLWDEKPFRLTCLKARGHFLERNKSLMKIQNIKIHYVIDEGENNSEAP